MAEISLFGSKSRQLAGLDITSSSIKLLELGNGDKGHLRVERYVIEALPLNAMEENNIANFDTVVDSLRRAWRHFGSGTKNVAIALPASEVFTKRILLPAGLRDTELEAQVESEVAQYIPFALEDVNLDFQVVGQAGSPDEVEVLVAASRKEKIDDRVGVAEACGLKVVVVDVESLARETAFERVALQLPGAARGRLVGLLDIGASAMSFTAIRDGQRLYTREQAFGGNQLTRDIARQYGMSQDEAEQAKRAGTLPEDYRTDVLPPFMDTLALEVSRALQFFFTSTQYNEVDFLVLAGGGASITGLAEIVSARTQIKTYAANPFAGMSVSAKLGSKKLLVDAPSLMVACGLALRRFDE